MVERWQGVVVALHLSQQLPHVSPLQLPTVSPLSSALLSRLPPPLHHSFSGPISPQFAALCRFFTSTPLFSPSLTSISPPALPFLRPRPDFLDLAVPSSPCLASGILPLIRHLGYGVRIFSPWGAMRNKKLDYGVTPYCLPSSTTHPPIVWTSPVFLRIPHGDERHAVALVDARLV